jgi:hypothetical protein
VCEPVGTPLYSGIRKPGLHSVLDIRLDLPHRRPAMEQGPLATAEDPDEQREPELRAAQATEETHPGAGREHDDRRMCCNR